MNKSNGNLYTFIGNKICINKTISPFELGIFEKYSKMKILGFEIFEKGQILRPFSGLAPSKLIDRY